MEKVNLFGQMVLFTKDNLKIIRFKERESIFGQMGALILDK